MFYLKKEKKKLIVDSIIQLKLLNKLIKIIHLSKKKKSNICHKSFLY